MAINNKVKVPVVGAANKSILLNPQATEGAVFGKDLFFGDGSTVVTLQNLAAALGITKTSAQPNILWNQLAAIPPNVIEVANLATAGIVRRLPDGHWITQPPSDFTGRPGAPGRRGDRGPPGVPGAPGAAGARGAGGVGIPGRKGVRGRQGSIGPPGTPGARGANGASGAAGISIPGRKGVRGRQGYIGPPGAQGATGPQGPAGSASGASGFPGYRQSRPRPRLLPWLDNAAPVQWSGSQTFKGPAARPLGTSQAQINIGAVSGQAFTDWISSAAPANARVWENFIDSTGSWTLRGVNDALNTATNAIKIDRTAAVLTAVTVGNATDNPPLGVFGALTVTAGAGGNTLTLNAAAGSPADIVFNISSVQKGVIGSAAAINSLITGSAAGDFCIRSTSGKIMLSIDGGTSEAISFNGPATSGTATGSVVGNNKPGPTINSAAARWLPVSFGGTQYYIPMWIS